MSSQRPYPNVILYKGSQGRDRWKAVHPRRGNPQYLGMFDTPQEARRAVLLAQAEHLETKAANYRHEADDIEGPLGA